MRGFWGWLVALVSWGIVGCSPAQSDTRGIDADASEGERHCRLAEELARAGRCLAAGEQLAHCEGPPSAAARAAAEEHCLVQAPVEPAPRGPQPQPPSPQPWRRQPPAPPPPPAPTGDPGPPPPRPVPGSPPPFVVPSNLPPLPPMPGAAPPPEPLRR